MRVRAAAVTIAAAVFVSWWDGFSYSPALLAKPQTTATPKTTATIAGRVTDKDGAPVAGADVQALSLRVTDAHQAPAAVASARTTDRGEFRLTGLAAGQYFVSAIDSSSSKPAEQPGVVRSVPTYYPGVVAVSEADPVTVAEGRDAARVDIRLRLIRPARISGIMGSGERRPLLSGAVILIPRDSLGAAAVPPEDVTIQPDGRFTFRNVIPGKYQIRARAIVGPKQPMLFGSFAVSVEDRDVGMARIALVPGARVQGRVELLSTKSTPLPPLKGLRVRAPFADGTSFGDALTGEVGADGSFRIDGAMPGRHYFAVEGLAEPWAVTAVMMPGRDLQVEPVDMHESQQLRDVRIVVSDAPTVVEGTVRDDSGRPLTDALVVAMPPPVKAWSPANPQMRTVRSDDAGRFRIRGLPAGSYQLAAVTLLDELALTRREWLTRLQSVATPLSLTAREERTLDLVARHAPLMRPVTR